MEYYAHSKKDSNNVLDKKDWQTLEEHSKNVAKLTGEFASKFGCEKIGYNIGLYHDLGKAQKEMVDKLEGKNIPVVHSASGAISLSEEYEENIKKKIIKEVICSHHGGLKDYGKPTDSEEHQTLIGFLQRNKMIADKEFDEFLKCLLIEDNDKLNVSSAFELYVICKMLHSCLIDADFLDTENFMNPTNRNFNIDWDNSKQVLETYISKFKDNSKINRLRKEFRIGVVSKSEIPIGIYSITAPPGIGKTLTSLNFAINHLIYNNLDGVVYSSPRISLTKQNADVIKTCIGKENVLEYHSSVNFNDLSSDESLNNLQHHCSENFDYPFIATTFNQLFNAFFKSNNSNNRRLHNLVNKIIIIDEAHLIPSQYLDAIIPFLKILTTRYHCSIIFVSATQFDYQFIKNDVESNLMDINPIELVSNTDYFIENTKRVNIINLGDISKTELIEKINNEESSLTIVDKRALAQEIFKNIDVKTKYCLSTLMCKKHIDETIDKMKDCNFNCALVSTSIVEVGMDFDFKKGFCNMKNIPSMNQCSGRVNREGKRPKEDFCIFSLNDEKTPSFSKQEIAISKLAMSIAPDILLTESINKYNELLVKLSPQERNQGSIYQLCSKLEYETVDDIFEMIESPTIPVLIPYNDEAKKIIENISLSKDLKNKRIQLYIVNLYQNVLNDFLRHGHIKKMSTFDNVEYFVLNNDFYYDKTVGLIVDESFTPNLMF